MADRGTMIELRVDTGRIARLAPLHLTTVLADGPDTASIVAPPSGPFREAAETGQTRIKEETGVCLPILDEREFQGMDQLRGGVGVKPYLLTVGSMRWSCYLECAGGGWGQTLPVNSWVDALVVLS